MLLAQVRTHGDLPRTTAIGECGSTRQLGLPSPPQVVGWVSSGKQDGASQQDHLAKTVIGADPKSAAARADQRLPFLALGNRLARMRRDFL